MKGYRDEHVFGDGITDPLEVAYYETRDLGNTDIVERLLRQGDWNNEERVFLQTILDYEPDRIDKEYFFEIVRKCIGDRNFCKWLCKDPRQVFSYYVWPTSGYGKNLGLFSYDEYLKADRLTEYEIPDDAVKLVDLGGQGALYAWKM